MKSLNTALQALISGSWIRSNCTRSISATRVRRVLCMAFCSFMYVRRNDTSSAWFCSPIKNESTDAFADSAKLFPDLKQSNTLLVKGAAHRCFSGKIESRKPAAAPPHLFWNSATFCSHSVSLMSGSCNIYLKSFNISFFWGWFFTHSAKLRSLRCQLQSPARIKQSSFINTSSLTSRSDIVTLTTCCTQGTIDLIDWRIQAYASLLSCTHKQKAMIYNLFSSSITVTG